MTDYEREEQCKAQQRWNDMQQKANEKQSVANELAYEKNHVHVWQLAEYFNASMVATFVCECGKMKHKIMMET